MQRKNFSFRFEWHQAIAHLDPEQRLEIYEQTIQYAATGKVCFQSGIAALAFEKYILPDFRRREKAAEYRARRKAAKATETTTSENPELSENSENSEKAPVAPLPNRRQRRMIEAEQKRRHRKRRHPRRGAPRALQ